MAYNPFNFFRRNSKIVFAMFTVFVMFTFVLNFGPGDFFTWFPRWLEGLKSKGDPVAVVGGKKITDFELEEQRRVRATANAYMASLAGQERRLLGETVRSKMEALAKDAKRDAIFDPDTGRLRPEEEWPASVRMMKLHDEIRGTFELDMQSFRMPSFDREALDYAIAQVAKLEGSAILFPEMKETAELLRNYGQAGFAWLTRLQSGGREAAERSYFVNQPNETLRDQLDYRLWLKKAEQLGIVLTQSDVKQLVEREFPSIARNDAKSGLFDENATEATKGSRELTKDDLYATLGDEFRVRSAQSAVLGQRDVRSLWGNPATPIADKRDFFRKETELTKLGLMTIPVEPFESLVTGEPSAAELREIFNANKRLDPDPRSSKLGLKEPRKIRVQFVDITDALPYYDAPTKARVQRGPAAMGLLGSAVANQYPAADYADYAREQNGIADAWKKARNNPGTPTGPAEENALVAAFGGLAADDAKFVFRKPPLSAAQPLADATVARVQNVGMLAGILGGAFATAGSPLTAPVLVAERGYTAETELRLLAGIRGFVLPTIGGDSQPLSRLAGELAVTAALPQPLTQNFVQPYLEAQSQSMQRTMTVAEDVRNFGAELAKIMSNKDRAAAEKQAAEFTAAWLAARSLAPNIMATPRDIDTLYLDPGLRTLVDRSSGLHNFVKVDKLDNSRVRRSFAYPFFFETQAGEKGANSTVAPSTALYVPRIFKANGFSSNGRYREEENAPDAKPSINESSFSTGPVTLFWLVQNVDAVMPIDFNDPTSQAKCKAAWKRMKARELAKKAAEEARDELIKLAEAGGRTPDAVEKAARDVQQLVIGRLPADARIAALDRLRLITKADQYDNAKFFYRLGFQSPAPQRAEFDLQPSDDILYPSDKMIDEMRGLRDQPVGTAIATVDQPESMVYVAFVEAKVEQPRDHFQRFVLEVDPFDDENPGDMNDPVAMQRMQMKRMSMQQLRQFRSGFMGQYTAHAAKAARAEAVELLKAEFGVTGESEKLDEKKKDR